MKCNLQMKNKKRWEKDFPHSSEIWFYDAVAQETSVSNQDLNVQMLTLCQENPASINVPHRKFALVKVL